MNVRKEFLQVEFQYNSPLRGSKLRNFIYYRNKHLPYRGIQAWYEAHLSYEYHFHLVLSCNTPSQSSGTKHRSWICQEKTHTQASKFPTGGLAHTSNLGKISNRRKTSKICRKCHRCQKPENQHPNPKRKHGKSEHDCNQTITSSLLNLNIPCTHPNNKKQ